MVETDIGSDWTWQCSLCQQYFTTHWDSELQEDVNCPDVAQDEHFLCESCADLLPDRYEIEPGDIDYLVRTKRPELKSHD